MKTRFFFACLLSSALAWADSAPTGPVEAAIAVKIYNGSQAASKATSVSADDVRRFPAFYLEFNDPRNVAYYAHFLQNLGQYPAQKSGLPPQVHTVVELVFAHGRKALFLTDGQRIYRSSAGQIQAFDCRAFKNQAELVSTRLCYAWDRPFFLGGQ